MKQILIFDWLRSWGRKFWLIKKTSFRRCPLILLFALRCFLWFFSFTLMQNKLTCKFVWDPIRFLRQKENALLLYRQMLDLIFCTFTMDKSSEQSGKKIKTSKKCLVTVSNWNMNVVLRWLVCVRVIGWLIDFATRNKDSLFTSLDEMVRTIKGNSTDCKEEITTFFLVKQLRRLRILSDVETWRMIKEEHCIKFLHRNLQVC